MKKLTEKVKNYAKELGADFVGIAPIGRFKNAPLRMSPQGILPEAQSVIVCGIHHLDAAIELAGEPTPHNSGPYATQSSYMNPKLDDISFLVARFLEDRGYKTVPIVSSNIWRYSGYKELKVHFAPDIAHRYAAVAAGLGEIGWSGLFLHPEYGPRVRLVSIITEAKLFPDPMYSGEKLCDRCMECVKHCLVDAFRKEVKKINKIEIDGKTFFFPDINKWRCGWAENFGLNLALPIPEKIDEKVILENIEKYGFFAGEIGSCLRFCMVPKKRFYDTSYSKAPLRKKTKKPVDIRKMKKILEKYLIDYCRIERIRKGLNFFHPEYHLPDAESMISLGIKLPRGWPSEHEKFIRNRILEYASFELAHHFDMMGHPAIMHTSIDDNLVAHISGIWKKDVTYSTVLTGAKLYQFTFVRKIRKEKIEKEKFRKFCLMQGADIVGFFDNKRFEEFKTSFIKNFRFFQEKEVIYDVGGLYGKYSPIVKKEKLVLKTPQDYLEGAKSVIVLGLHFPDTPLDIAKITPAESIGPYAFVQFESLNLLADIGYRICKKINDCGYRTNFSYDLTALASKVLSSRGLLPDMRANSYAGMLAGLGYIGKNGCLITKNLGQRQRLLAIVTDFEFPSDPLYEGENFCKGCDECIKHCPVSAIKRKVKKVEIEGIKFEIPRVDEFTCDVAKRYALVGKEGPAYMGSKVDTTISEKSTETLIKKLLETDWGVQKRHLNICEECIRICPFKGKRRHLC